MVLGQLPCRQSMARRSGLAQALVMVYDGHTFTSACARIPQAASRGTPHSQKGRTMTDRPETGATEPSRTAHPTGVTRRVVFGAAGGAAAGLLAACAGAG